MNYIGHIAFGLNAYSYGLKENVDDFPKYLTGCVAADIARCKNIPKDYSHYRELSKALYAVPDLKRFCKKYILRFDDPFVIGYFCHLYADMVFTSVYLPSIAEPLDANYKPSNTKESKYVRITKNNSIIPVTTFLSATGIYDDYTKTNEEIARAFNFPENLEFSTEYPEMEEIDKNNLQYIPNKIAKYLGESAAAPLIKGDTLAIDKEEYIQFIKKNSEEFCLVYKKCLEESNY